MPEEEYSVKTVAQLKIILQEKGLPVSGKKADLIARLVEDGKPTNPKSTVIVDSVQKDGKSSTKELPFFTSILENGIDSVDFDKEQTIRYAITAFMLTMILVSLNSMSWYYYSLDFDYEEGMWGDQKTGTTYGLGIETIANITCQRIWHPCCKRDTRIRYTSYFRPTVTLFTRSNRMAIME